MDTGKLDFLVDMVGEMVIAQSLVRHDPDLATGVKPRLARNLSQLSRITDDVQRTAMSMRMIPIGQLFQKTARLVRDLSRKAGKQVELELIGEETELDRNIVEELADPLMHMVRNAVDHGIETPEQRERAGKSATAKVTLKAGHQAGHIVIQVSDDGRGLDREKILSKAREKNLVSEDAPLSESEIFNLIFHPGFSTAEKITDVSGRGVGMDVVRRHIQKLRGRIDILSKAGRGNHLRAEAAADSGHHRRAGGGGGEPALHRSDFRRAGNAQAGRGCNFHHSWPRGDGPGAGSPAAGGALASAFSCSAALRKSLGEPAHRFRERRQAVLPDGRRVNRQTGGGD